MAADARRTFRAVLLLLAAVVETAALGVDRAEEDRPPAMSASGLSNRVARTGKLPNYGGDSALHFTLDDSERFETKSGTTSAKRGRLALPKHLPAPRLGSFDTSAERAFLARG